MAKGRKLFEKRKQKLAGEGRKRMVTRSHERRVRPIPCCLSERIDDRRQLKEK